MTASTTTDRRKYHRILLPEGGMIRCRGVFPKFDGVISVIGMGGMFIRTRESQPFGSAFSVRIEDTSLTFTVECRVCDVTTNGLGVEFTGVSAGTQRKIQDLLQRLRP